MKERPIIFSAPMVRALLRGDKTQTRRVVKTLLRGCPYGKPGDRLWVKESYIRHASIHDFNGYCADGAQCTDYWERKLSARYMPRRASRILLEIAELRIHRLTDISEADAEAEGVMCIDPELGVSLYWVPGFHDTWTAQFYSACEAFRDYWNSLNPKHPWGGNPWVWAITFKVVQP